MLKPVNRLKKKKDFERVFEKGKGFKADFLFFKAAKSKTGISRFGFAVSRKVSKKAVERNRIKRCLRELVRLRLDKMKGKIDGVIVVLPEAENKNFKEIENALSMLFQKSGIY